MLRPTLNSRFAPLWFNAGLMLLGAVLLAAVILLSQTFATNVGDMLTRNTIRLALGWYAVAMCMMTRLHPDDWSAATRRGRAARWCWTWALTCFLIHVLMAFHYFHDWSHAAAFEHTRQVSGVGAGIYFSYVFTLIWAADVAYWWVLPAEYAARSVRVDRLLHGFMLFMVFNSTVIYESGLTRWAGLLMFVVVAKVWLTSKSGRSRAE